MNAKTWSTFAVALLFAWPVCAQEAAREQGKNQGIFTSREQYNQFMAKLRALNDPEINKMIPALNDVIMASHGLKKQPFGSPFHSERSWMMRMLDNDGVREEIEMLDYQYEDLKKFSQQIHDRMADQIRDVIQRQSTGDVDSRELVDQLVSIRDRAEAELDQSLLPTQQKRLRQLLMQGRLLREPLIRVVTTAPIADELELTDSQKESLKAEWKEIEQKMNADIAKLRARARKELAAKLKGPQKKKFEDLFGADYQFKANPDDAQNNKRRGKN